MAKVNDLIDSEIAGLIEKLSDRDIFLLKLTIRGMASRIIYGKDEQNQEVSHS